MGLFGDGKQYGDHRDHRGRLGNQDHTNDIKTWKRDYEVTADILSRKDMTPREQLDHFNAGGKELRQEADKFREEEERRQAGDHPDNEPSAIPGLSRGQVRAVREQSQERAKEEVRSWDKKKQKNQRSLFDSQLEGQVARFESHQESEVFGSGFWSRALHEGIPDSHSVRRNAENQAGVRSPAVWGEAGAQARQQTRREIGDRPDTESSNRWIISKLLPSTGLTEAQGETVAQDFLKACTSIWYGTPDSSAIEIVPLKASHAVATKEKRPTIIPKNSIPFKVQDRTWRGYFVEKFLRIYYGIYNLNPTFWTDALGTPPEKNDSLATRLASFGARFLVSQIFRALPDQRRQEATKSFLTMIS